MKQSPLLFRLILLSLSIGSLTNGYSQEATKSAPTAADSVATVSPGSTRMGQQVAGSWAVAEDKTEELISEDLGDLTLLMPGLFFQDLGSIGQFSPLIARGLSPQSLTFQVDGAVVREPILGFVNSNYGQINVIKSLHFLGIGPNALFGAPGHAGTLLLKTFDFEGSKPYSRVQFRAGDWGYSDIGLVVGLPVSKSLDLVVTGSRQEFDGFQANRGHVGGKAFSRLSYKPTANFQLQATTFLNKDEVEIPAPLLPDFVPWTSTAKRKEDRLDQIFSLRLGNLSTGGKELLAHLSLSRTRQQSLSDSLLFDNKNFEGTTGLQYQIRKARTKWTVGAEFILDNLSSQQISDKTDELVRVFTKGEVNFVDRVSLSFQGTAEKKNGFATALNPSLSVAWAVSPASKIWIAVQRATRYPSFSERLWRGSYFLGSSDLNLETSTSAEIGLRHEPSNSVRLQTAVFATRVHNWIGTIVADSLELRAVNLGNRTTYGLDFNFTLGHSPSRQLGISGQYLAARETELEKQLQVPEYSVYSYLQLGRPFFQEYVFVTVRLVGRFLGPRWGYDFAQSQVLPTLSKSGMDALLDAQVGFRFSEAKLSVSWENILDRRYQLVPGFFMPPRTFRLNISWEFWD